MSSESNYFEVKEIIDRPRGVSDYINGGGWDLLLVAARKKELANGVYTDQVVYVIGHRADAR